MSNEKTFVPDAIDEVTAPEQPAVIAECWSVVDKKKAWIIIENTKSVRKAIRKSQLEAYGIAN